MKYYILYQENDNFDSFLNDSVIKENCKNYMRWTQHLLIVFDETTKEDIKSYIMLKYGDNIKSTNSLFQDFTPTPYVDYKPTRSIIPSVQKFK